MRAIYLPFEKATLSGSLTVIGNSANHLNIARVKVADEVLVLNGHGIKLITQVDFINKNKVELLIKELVMCDPPHHISLAIANPKKDAFEDILKIAVELGIVNIYPLSSQFSQYDYIQSERVQRVFESGLVQSNNPIFPIIHEQKSLKHFIETHENPLYFFNSNPSTGGKNEKVQVAKTILIGPEGGFSPVEESFICSRSNTFSIHLSTPILRSPTAVAASIGYLLTLT